MDNMRPIHPGEVLREEFMEPLGLSAYRVAKTIGVPPNRIQAIVLEQRGVTPDTAVRLGKAFNTSAEFWLNLQQSYDLKMTKVETQNIPNLVTA